MSAEIEAVAFDCFGTLIDFGDEAFAEAYGLICAEQDIDIDGQAFYEKWMEVWRRLIVNPEAPLPSAGLLNGQAPVNVPAPLSKVEDIPEHPDHHAPSAGRSRALDGPVGPFRTYREEWTEHFALCFEELGVPGDASRAHARLIDLLCHAPAFPESRRVVERVARRLPTAMLSNADDDFLYPTLNRNGLIFPITISSQSAHAYKPHAAIFRQLSESMGIATESILYVGDSKLADVTGAKNAGLQAAWLNRELNTEWSVTGRTLLAPDYELHTLDDLIEVLGF